MSWCHSRAALSLSLSHTSSLSLPHTPSSSSPWCSQSEDRWPGRAAAGCQRWTSRNSLERREHTFRHTWQGHVTFTRRHLSPFSFASTINFPEAEERKEDNLIRTHLHGGNMAQSWQCVGLSVDCQQGLVCQLLTVRVAVSDEELQHLVHCAHKENDPELGHPHGNQTPQEDGREHRPTEWDGIWEREGRQTVNMGLRDVFVSKSCCCVFRCVFSTHSVCQLGASQWSRSGLHSSDSTSLPHSYGPQTDKSALTSYC